MQYKLMDASARRMFEPGVLIAFLLVLMVLRLDAQSLVVRFEKEMDLSVVSGVMTSKNVGLQTVLTSLKPATINRPLIRFRKSLPTRLHQVQIWQFTPDIDLVAARKQLLAIDGVLSVEALQHYRIQRNQSDPLRNEQWYLDTIRAPEAWLRNSGNEQVVVGVIDTGVDYLHEDLHQQMWINAAEDLNGNGMLDSLDLNGIDDDGNGYIDDVVGWDFTNAPNFPDRGDFLVPDNDPMDEFLSGHGTPAAGIIAAKRDNGIGISGIAPHARIMALRAGTSSGFLEEDDVAEAIIYAVENGCKIVNMSFGDVAVSFLLQDAIAYGASLGVLFVASAGNSSSSTANYPAAFDETVSVGATNESNSLAPFSNYGSKLDLVGPGQAIMATEIDDEYGAVDGTSFSAPVVSAVAALIWSEYPDFTVEQVKSALFAGAEDFGQFGWDTFYGHGRVDALGSLQVGRQGVARITQPATDTGISTDQIAVIGSVFSPSLQGYSLAYGVGTTPQLLTALTDLAEQQVVDDTLFVWDVSSLADSIYTLELTLEQTGGNDLVFRSTFNLDRTAPAITVLDTVRLLIGPDNGYLVTMTSDDPVSAELRLRQRGNSQAERILSSSYFRRDHHFLVSQNDISGPLEFDIRIENSAGLASIIDDNGQFFSIQLDEALPSGSILLSTGIHNFSGFLMPVLKDLNRNLTLDLVYSQLNADNQFGPVVVSEYANGAFQERLATDFPGIPRDAEQLFDDGGGNILSGFGSNSLILGGNGPDSYPASVSWFDTTDFWGSRFANLDADPEPELLALTFGKWKVFDITSTYQLEEKYVLSDTTAGSNQFGVPISVVADLDGDTDREIAIGDLDGDLYIYDYKGGEGYRFTWSTRLNGRGGNGLLAAADIDGDGGNELISIVRNEPPVILESNVNTRYWSMEIWKTSGNNQYKRIWQQNFHGITVQPGVFNGLATVDINHDGVSEILFTPFPEAYLLEWQGDQLVTIWYQDGINSNTALQSDFDGDGRTEILLNTDEGMVRFESALDANRPLPPLQVAAIALNTESIYLSWRETEQAESYRVYRAVGSGPMVLHDSLAAGFLVDTTLTAGIAYQYAVSIVDSAFQQAESPRSEIVTATPNAAPELENAIVLSARQLRLAFSEAMSDETFRSERYWINGLNKFPLSTVRAADGKEVLLSFDKPLPAGDHELLATGLADRTNTPMADDTLRVDITIAQSSEALYVQQLEFLNKRSLRLVFSDAVDPASVVNPDNYHLSPDGEVLAARPDSLNARVVYLDLDGRNRLGALGVAYTLTVTGVTGADGRLLDIERSNQVGIPVAKAVLSDAFVYPNPYNAVSHSGPLRFANLPRNAEVFIFSSGGELLQTLAVDNDLGGVPWNLMTSGGDFVGSGVYIYVIRLNGEEEKGKFVIVK